MIVDDHPRPQKEVKTKEQLAKAKRRNWVILITIITFFLSFAINLISEVVISNAVTGVAMIILLIIVLLGILFDIIGIATTAASEAPFHSMASNKVPGAQHAINIIRNAEKVSNFCNDVIGDIAGIVSGATVTVVVMRICQSSDFFNDFWTGLIFTAIVAAITVGGKGAGKSIAISKSNEIVFAVGKLFYFFTSLLCGGKKNGRKSKVSKK